MSNTSISAVGLIERAVLSLLLTELARERWLCRRTASIGEGFDWSKVPGCDPDIVKVRVFKHDTATHLEFQKGKRGGTHWVQLGGSEGWDMLADWDYTEGDPDGFNALMNRVQYLIDHAPLRFTVPHTLRLLAEKRQP